tara:strand:- start:476126 stop:476923 length:798 start_codon:yes stop_codon:yes gene_type:complete
VVFKLSKAKVTYLSWIFVHIYCLCVTNHAQAGSFVIGVEDISYYPYFDFNSNQTTFSKAIFDQFAKENGHQISYLPLPIRQFPKWLYEENIDFKFPDNVRWQERNNGRQLRIHFSDEIVAMTAGTLVMPKNKDKDPSFFKTIGTITGFHPTLWVKQLEQGKVTIYEDSSAKILVKHLVNGLIDGLDIDLAVANVGLQNLHIQQDLVFNENLPKQNYSYQISTVKYPEIIKQFNQWLVKRRDYIDSQKIKYGILEHESRKATIVNQ